MQEDILKLFYLFFLEYADFEIDLFHIHVYPLEKDITAIKNNIISIRDQDVEVQAIAVDNV